MDFIKIKNKDNSSEQYYRGEGKHYKNKNKNENNNNENINIDFNISSKINGKKEIENQVQNTSIFRFKLSDCIVNLLNNFVEIHKYDNKNDFKDAWNDFIKNNVSIIDKERKRLRTMGFNGDLNEKMYKSARYYLSKKTNVKEVPKKRRTYITIDNEVIKLIDIHCRIEIHKDNKPSVAYENFCEKYENILIKICKNIINNSNLDKEDVDLKMKKTYKNRYFIQNKKILDEKSN